LSAHGSLTAGRRRRRGGGAARWLARIAVVVASIAAIAIGVGYAFAGAPNTLSPGTEIGGVDVGGMTVGHARAVLERKAARLANVPVVFVANGRTWKIRPYELGVTADWGAAVKSVHTESGGLAVVRGYRRLARRVFPERVTPKARAYDAAVAYKVGLLAAAIDRPARSAKLVRHGVQLDIVGGRPGAVLQRNRAIDVIVPALASFERTPIRLPVKIEKPEVTEADLQPAWRVGRRVLSAPVTLVLAGKRLELTPAQLAPMLVLPKDADTKPQLGGHAADRYFAKLDRTVSHPPRNATFSVYGPSVRVVPARPGLGLDVAESSAALFAAAKRRSTGRVARLSVGKVLPERGTAEAKAMGITGLVGSYETIYGGIPNRIHNVQLVAHLVDDKLIAPGATFSFNGTTGERTAAKGFLEAPVIINGELSTGLGGGICQVSTTVFNAAYEAGLPIATRTNHALYISHYPLGRDATVDYPNIDLKFVNDTGHWLLLRTFVGSSSLVVSLYGSPQHRRVVTETSPLRVTAAPPVIRKLDKSLKPGQQVVDEYGAPAQATSVHRTVYTASGKLLYDSTWSSSYRSEPKVIRFGPKKPKKPKKPVEPPVTAPTGKQPL
jgi:vancomycin resistance protein YoaR